MLIKTNIHFPVAANLPALNLRLIQETENPKEKLEIAEASVQALGEVPKYEEVARLTRETLDGITGTMRRQAMLSAALSAMASCPSLACVGPALIGHAPRAAKERVADQVLTQVQKTTSAPELQVARLLLEDPILTPGEKAEVVQSAVDGTARDGSLLEATADIVDLPFEKASHRVHAAQLALSSILPIVPSYSRDLLEVALSQLSSNPRPKSSLQVVKELLWAANEERGRELTTALYSAMHKTEGSSREALLQDGFQVLRDWSSVEGIGSGLDLVESVSQAAGPRAKRIRESALEALVELNYGESPSRAIAGQIVRLARYPEAQGGIGETQACEPVLVAVLEAMKAHVADPDALQEAIVRLKAVEPSDTLPIGRSSRQAIIAGRAIQNAQPR